MITSVPPSPREPSDGDRLEDQHPEWSGPDKGTHGWVLILYFVVAIVVIAGFAVYFWPR